MVFLDKTLKEKGTHDSHCDQGEEEDSCKYGDYQFCTALSQNNVYALELFNRLTADVSFDEAMRIRDILNGFFAEVFVIEYGKYRHPYANTIHAWVEGATIQLKTHEGGKWYDMITSVWEQFNVQYRIKPKEPVYEYQWLHMSKTSNECMGVTLEYYTEDEATDDVYKWVKIEETKRERK
jgi:hypothetical protein